LDLTLRLSTLYDSNVTQASGVPGNLVESDFLLQPELKLAYLVGGGSFQLGATADFEYRKFSERDDFSTFNYFLKAYGGYRSEKAVASFSSSYRVDGGVNRQTGLFLEQNIFSNRLQARYLFSGKTSLFSALAHSLNNVTTMNFADTESLSLELSALWQASPLISFGPGVSYGTRSGGTPSGLNDAELTLLGPSLRMNYQLTEKVKLRSKVGLNFAQSSLAQDEQLFNWALAFNYRASSFWGVDLAMIGDSQGTLDPQGDSRKSNGSSWEAFLRASPPFTFL